VPQGEATATPPGRVGGRALRLAHVGSWALLDQGLFATANFGLNIALARWLTAEEYGSFALAFGVMLLAGAVHAAVLVDPLLVYGSDRYAQHRAGYLGRLSQAHLAFSVVVAMLLVVGALVVGASGGAAVVRTALLGAAGATPFVLWLWLLRRACYLRRTPRLAAMVGLLYVGLLAAGAAVLIAADRMSVVAAWGLLAVASAVSAVVLARRLGVAVHPTPAAREVVRDHWRWGRWAVPSAAVAWVPANVFVYVLPVWHSITATAEFRAGMNLVLPVMHVNAAVGNVLLPSLVRSRGGPEHAAKLRLAALLLVVPNLLYAGLVVLGGDWLAGVLYGGRYEYSALQLVLLACLPLLTIPTFVWGAACRSVERPDLVLVGYVAATVVACTVGIAVVAAAGVTGALAAQGAVSLVTGGTLAWAFVRRRPDGWRGRPVQHVP
jgi:O-antigen/teichoic acid export membrane protein